MDLAGIYIIPSTTFGDFLMQIEEDGTLTFAGGEPENLKDPINVSKTWFENRIYHIRMTDAVFQTDAICVELDPTDAYEGIYKIWRQANGNITFDTYADGCRSRVFTLVGAKYSATPMEWQPYP